MAKETDIIETNEAIEKDLLDVEDPRIVKFEHPYEFEGQTYTQFDISNCDYKRLTTADVIRCKNIAKMKYGLRVASAMENVNSFTDDTVVKILLSHKCGVPIEFFDNLPFVEFFKIQAALVTLVGSAD